MNLVLVVACLQAVTIMYKITPPPLPPKSGRPLYKPPIVYIVMNHRCYKTACTNVFCFGRTATCISKRN